MTDIFISYARSTAEKAQRIAEALRALGYGVWRHDELPAHRAYAAVIQERLKAAKAEIEARLELDGSNDLRPVIRELMDAARKAEALESGVGMRAAADMYAEAARLKQALARPLAARPPATDEDCRPKGWKTA